MKYHLFISFVLLLLISCASSKLFKTQHIKKISLDGNPTTGYSWYFAGYGYGDDIVSLKDSEYKENNNKDGLVGVGGVFDFAFSAQKEGEAELIFEYKRPWEDAALSEKKVIVKVNKKLEFED